MSRVETCLLELLERAAGFDTLMLAAVADEDDTVSLFQSMQKRIQCRLLARLDSSTM